MGASLFLSDHEEAIRLRALAAYRILDTPPELVFDRITALASRSLRTPIAQITLVAEDRQWFKSSHGLDKQETPRQQSICAHALASEEVLIVPDATRDPRFAENPLVTGPPGIRFYAGAPLLVPRLTGLDQRDAQKKSLSVCLGTLCVIDTRPRAGLTGEETDNLRDLAALTVEALLSRLAGEHQREETAGRERAEAAWRRSENSYRRSAANPLGMMYQFVRRPDGTSALPLVGEGCREVYGLSPRDVQREPRLIYHCVLPEHRKGLRASIAESTRTLQPLRWEGPIRLTDGTMKWIATSARPERLPDGTTVWDGVVTDITAQHEAREGTEGTLEARVRERTASLTAANHVIRSELAELRRAGEASRESRELAETVVENAMDAVYVKDLAGRYLLVNPAGARAMGYPVGEILGRDDRALFSPESAGALMAKDRAIMQEGRPAAPEDILVPLGGGKQRIFASRKVPLRDSHGDITGLVGISRDITELKASERALRDRARQQAAVARLGQSALEDSGGGLEALFQEAVGIVVETLGADFATVFEFLPGENVLVRRAGHGWPAEAFGQINAAARAGVSSVAGYTLLTGQAVVREDMREERAFQFSEYARRHGAVGVASVVIARERRDGEAPSPAPAFGVLSALFRQPRACSAEDVAFLQAVANILAAAIGRSRAESAVRQAKEEVERANAVKSEFLSRMSHELRTPLNAILGFGQLLKIDAQTSGQRESVDQVLRAGWHLVGLIDEVLDISDLEAGRPPMKIAPVSPLELMQKAAALVRDLAAERGVAIAPPTAEPAELAGQRVAADAHRLHQALLHLVTNAVKYNRPGGHVTLTVTPTGAGEDAAGRGALRLSVRDTGPGISPEHQPRLFTPVERLETDRHGVEGAGIGLVRAKRLVEAQGGRIGMESELGAGSTFWVELPL